MAKKKPLRNLTGGAHRGRGLGRLGNLARFKKSSGAGSGAVSGLRLWSGSDGRGLVDDDGPHAGEVKSSKKRSDGQLAGLAEVHQELHHGGTDFAEFAWKLVGAGLFGGIGFSAEKFGPGVGQTLNEIAAAHARVDQHRDRACFEESKDALDELDAWRNEQGDASSILNAQRAEAGRDPIGGVVELAKRDACGPRLAAAKPSAATPRMRNGLPSMRMVCPSTPGSP